MSKIQEAIMIWWAGLTMEEVFIVTYAGIVVAVLAFLPIIIWIINNEDKF